MGLIVDYLNIINIIMFNEMFLFDDIIKYLKNITY